nr:uncharacterized PE-PGRS family protein PE_PGRS54-like [Aegilops tauschii subsp. strangulata]
MRRTGARGHVSSCTGTGWRGRTVTAGTEKEEAWGLTVIRRDGGSGGRVVDGDDDGEQAGRWGGGGRPAMASASGRPALQIGAGGRSCEEETRQSGGEAAPACWRRTTAGSGATGATGSGHSERRGAPPPIQNVGGGGARGVGIRGCGG